MKENQIWYVVPDVHTNEVIRLNETELGNPTYVGQVPCHLKGGVIEELPAWQCNHGTITELKKWKSKDSQINFRTFVMRGGKIVPAPSFLGIGSRRTFRMAKVMRASALTRQYK